MSFPYKRCVQYMVKEQQLIHHMVWPSYSKH